VGVAATAQDTPALTLGAAAPDAVIDVVLEGVLQAGLGHGALGTDLLRHQHPHPIAREEEVRCNFLAFPPGHPFSIHFATPFSRTILEKRVFQENNRGIGSS
jgi:hypothetical protein